MIVGNIKSELSESVKSQIDILSKETLSQCQNMVRLKGSKEEVPRTLSTLHKKSDHTIRGSIRQA